MASDIKPEDLGLCFDRARMNSSNRKSIDYFKNKLAGLNPDPDSSQEYSKFPSVPTMQIKLKDLQNSKLPKDNTDITNFLKKKSASSQKPEPTEYCLDDLLEPFDTHKEVQNSKFPEENNVENEEDDYFNNEDCSMYADDKYFKE